MATMHAVTIELTTAELPAAPAEETAAAKPAEAAPTDEGFSSPKPKGYRRYSSVESEGQLESEDKPPELARQCSVTPEVRQAQVGVLTVNVKRAHNLVAMDSNGLSDPFAVVTVHGKRRFRTRLEKKTLNPRWDQVGTYPGALAHFLKSPMIVHLYDHDLLSTNDPLGSVTVDLAPLLQTNKISLRQEPLVGVAHGTLDLTVSFEQTAVNFAFPG